MSAKLLARFVNRMLPTSLTVDIEVQQSLSALIDKQTEFRREHGETIAIGTCFCCRQISRGAKGLAVSGPALVAWPVFAAESFKIPDQRRAPLHMLKITLDRFHKIIFPWGEPNQDTTIG